MGTSQKTIKALEKVLERLNQLPVEELKKELAKHKHGFWAKELKKMKYDPEFNKKDK